MSPTMHTTLLLGFASLLAVFTHAKRPDFSPLFGIQELENPSWVDGRKMSHDFLWQHNVQEDKNISLKYNVELVETPILALKQELSVISVLNCDSLSSLTLVMADPAAAESLRVRLTGRKHLLAGGREWGCTKDGKPTTLHRHVVGVEQAANHLSLRTAPASPAEFFKHASVAFHINSYPEGHFQHTETTDTSDATSEQSATPAVGSGGARRLLRCCHRIRNAVAHVVDFFHSVPTFDSRLASAVSAVVRVVKDVVTATFDVDKDMTLAHISLVKGNGPGLTSSNSFDGVTLDSTLTARAWATASLGVHFQLDVANYQLSSMGAWVYGSADIGAQASLNMKASADFQDSLALGTVTSPDVCFDIGVVPICVHLSVPVELVASSSANVDVVATAGASLSGSVTAGFVYSNAAFDWKFSHTLSPQAKAPTTTVDGTFTASVEINPTFTMIVDNIGGALLSASGGLELVVTADSGSCAHANLNALLKAGVGVSLDIEFAGHTLYNKQDSQTFYNSKLPIASYCLSSVRRRRLAAALPSPHTRGYRQLAAASVGDSSMSRGALYHGTHTPRPTPYCAARPMSDVTAQYLDFESLWIIAFSRRADRVALLRQRPVVVEDGCVTQGLYKQSRNAAGQLVFTPQIDSRFNVTYTSCTDASSSRAWPLPLLTASMVGGGGGGANSSLVFRGVESTCYPPMVLTRPVTADALLPSALVASAAPTPAPPAAGAVAPGSGSTSPSSLPAGATAAIAILAAVAALSLVAVAALLVKRRGAPPAGSVELS